MDMDIAIYSVGSAIAGCLAAIAIAAFRIERELRKVRTEETVIVEEVPVHPGDPADHVCCNCDYWLDRRCSITDQATEPGHPCDTGEWWPDE